MGFWKELISDNNDINEKSFVGIISFFMMVFAFFVDIITGIWGVKLVVEEFIFNGFLFLEPKIRHMMGDTLAVFYRLFILKYYDDESIEIVEKFYKKDIEAFNFKFDNKNYAENEKYWNGNKVKKITKMFRMM